MAERRLARLRRLERVRANARHAVLAEAALAEAALGQFSALAGRTRALAADYAVAAGIRDGLALRQQLGFGESLRDIGRQAESDAGRARAIADARARDLATTERRRAAVEERVALIERGLRQRATVEAAPAAPRRAWHGS